ncbi:MAG TPA: winged helix-turn-helix domain-containing protein [Blastocatellia bacterium]|nr:winged helix-turn-helix domain-containing protein [Blastocatellia bacterium]
MQPKVSADKMIRFGEFELALKSGELRRNGSVIRLQPQPFKVLAFLASHAGQTVTRQELQEAIWGKGTFVDFEHGLNFCIKQIRTALGDDAQSPRLVETLPRRGYRFIAEVENVSGFTVAEQVLGESEVEKPVIDAPPSRIQSAGRRFALIGAIAAALVIAGYSGWRSLNRVAVPVSKVMIAVLPFDNLSGEAEQDYFSDGMTEEMIARLGRLHPLSLGVIARTSAMTYKGVNKDIARIGRELGVDFVVEGSVRREEDKVRITAQLIQVSDQTHLWSESHDRSIGDALEVQREVADQIAHALAIRLLAGKGSESSHSANPEAVDAYLRGRYLWNKGARESVSRSVGYFQQAIEKDPDYAAAFAGLADSYRQLGMSYVMLPAEAYPKATEAALRAVQLDPESANAYVSLGTIKFRYEWKWEDAERDFLRAIEINPSLGIAHHDYAWFLVAMERFDEGIDHMKLAQRLDPLSPLANSDVGWVYLMARRYDEAIEQIKRTLELEPTFGSALACLERAYTLKGQPREAFETLLKETREEGASFRDGDPAQSMKVLYRKRLEKKLAAMKAGLSSPYGAAMICMSAGEREQALEFLERAYQDRDPMLVAARTDPAFDDLRTDPRFAGLLKRIGFAR